MSRRRALELAAIVMVLAPVALFARWSWYQDGKGPTFRPAPDALEYAAAAQSIAQDGAFLLQVGPYRVRPRYPPGWPLVQSIALWAGLEGASLWRFTALFGVALATGIALLTRSAIETSRAAGTAPATQRTRRIALCFGVGAGLTWCLSPLAADAGGSAMSDEPTAAACFAALVCLGTALLRGGLKDGAVIRWALAGGLASGLALSMRAVEGLLLLPPLAWLALHGIRAHGWRRIARVAMTAALGALPPILATMAILVHSELSPWRWSAYEFWAPGRFGDLHVTFDWRYALVENPHIPAFVGATKVGQLRGYGLTFLGWTGPHGWLRFGTMWPALGWLALAALGIPRLARRAAPAGNDDLLHGAVAVSGWCVSHWLVFGAYFYPDPRFVLGALAWCPVALAVVLGTGAASETPRWRHAASVAAALVLALVLGDAWAHHPRERLYQPRNDETRAALHRFLAWDDATRAREQVPFDTVLAQALGWFPASRTQAIPAWGPLPAITQANLLERNGYLAANRARK